MAQVWRTEVRLEILLRTLGLSNAADTLIGNAVVRGVSGGERKRVTSAEMLVGPKVSPHAQSFSPHIKCHSRDQSSVCRVCAKMSVPRSVCCRRGCC